jgi:hypothetical protein
MAIGQTFSHFADQQAAELGYKDALDLRQQFNPMQYGAWLQQQIKAFDQYYLQHVPHMTLAELAHLRSQ